MSEVESRNGELCKRSTDPPFEAVLYYAYDGRPVIATSLALDHVQAAQCLTEWIRAQQEGEPYMTPHGLMAACEVWLVFRRTYHGT